ncbi:MAG: hypothetical protein JST22_19400 [Bacteroidetes bacterium]|nr:hypothetical protein [Bacteroidota bacterium]
MSDFVANIFINGVTALSGPAGGPPAVPTEFEFIIDGRINSVVAPIALGATFPFDTLLASPGIPDNPTVMPITVTVRPLSGGDTTPYTETHTLTIPAAPDTQEYILPLNGGKYNVDYRIAIEPVYAVAAPPCDVYPRLVNIYQTFAAVPIAGAPMTHPAIVEAQRLLQDFDASRRALAEHLAIDLTTVDPAAGTFTDLLRVNLNVTGLAYSVYRDISDGDRAQVDTFFNAMSAQQLYYIGDPTHPNPPTGDNCTRCAQWQDMFACLCKLCNMRCGLPLAVRQELDLVLEPAIDTIFGFVMGNWFLVGMPVVGWWLPMSPCDKLRMVASFITNLCMSCWNAPTGFMDDLGMLIDPMLAEYNNLKLLLGSYGLYTCGVPPAVDVPHCGTHHDLPDYYQFLGSGANDPLFLTYGPVNAINNSMNVFTTTRNSIVAALGLTPPISAPQGGTFFDNLQCTLGVLNIAYLRSNVLSPTLVTSMDSFVTGLRANVMSAVAIWGPNVGQPTGAPCDTCADWLDILRCLCRLCETSSSGCGTGSNDIASLLMPEVNVLYQLTLPQYVAMGVPAPPLTWAKTPCEMLQQVYSYFASNCQRCGTISQAFLTQVDIYRQRLRAKVDALRSGTQACCTICDDFCVAWWKVLSCLKNLCDIRGTLSPTLSNQIVAQFGAKVTTLYNLLYPTPISPPPGSTPFDIMCMQISQLVADHIIKICPLTHAVNGYLRVQLEILLLDFQDRYSALQPSLSAAGLDTCTDSTCECCLIQSPYIYLQAAGSDGSDNSSPGVQLRWGFLKKLGDQHLAKGNLAAPGATYATTIGFNKSNDFVRISRATYPPSYPTVLNANTIPTTIAEAGDLREWTYSGIAVAPGIATTLVLRFEDHPIYDAVRLAINPAVQPQMFLQTYSGVLQLGAKDKLAFAAEVTIARKGGGTYSLQTEAVSQLPQADKGDLVVTARQQFDNTNAGINSSNYRVVSESISYLRFRCLNSFPTAFRLETYNDYYLGTTRRAGWLYLNQFALSVTDGEVQTRLENGPFNNVDLTWPKFNDGATVKTGNYMNRWAAVDAPSEGLKSAVTSYLDYSRTDLYAKHAFNSDLAADLNHTPPDSSSVEISYLDALKFLASDYHVARMLGLGYIDGTVTNPAQQYIYMMEYITLVPIDGTVTGRTRHIYLSLPTGMPDYRLPVTPDLAALTFGLRVPDGTDQGALITDDQGYTPFDDKRFINVNRTPLVFDQQVGTFFGTLTQFSRNVNTKPVAYGVEYKLSSDSGWRTPELSSDTDYLDSAGHAETVPIPEGPNPIFVHRESEEGLHKYAIYGINWFSRPSPLGATIQNTTTTFPNRCTLQAPTNLTVQYIQTEEPRIFTTLNEQQNHIHDTRVTFYWTHQHNIAYSRVSPARFADAVEIYFRASGPNVVRGEISNVQDAGGGLYAISTSPLPQASQGSGMDVQPTVTAGTEARYSGSLLITPTAQYVVTAVVASTPTTGAVFTVRPAKSGSLTDADGTNNFVSTVADVTPDIGERFIVTENLADPTIGWTKLTKRVTLHSFTPFHTETVINPDGSSTVLNVGGAFGAATVTHLGDGVYSVVFSSLVLPTVPAGNTDVDWYKGVARIAAGSEMKALDVWRIETNGVSPLTIYVVDPDYAANPISTGAGVNVNFHPGYRVYLHYDTPNGFTASAIEPAAGEGSHFTYMAVAAVDDSPSCRSLMSTPVMLIAREITTPVVPNLPVGPKYATRPDFYGRSTYTFDTVVNPGGTNPFAMVFYRANERAILDAIYEPATADAVMAAVAPLGEDGFDAGWNELVNGVYDTGTGQFKVHGSYHFPNPDRAHKTYDAADYPVFTGADLNVALAGGRHVIDDVMLAIAAAFTPMNRTPVLYNFIRSGKETSNEAPTARDANGDLIPPTDPAFHPAPMARLLSAGNVRYTDYTLDGAARSLYFYAVAGMTNKLELSARSGVLGPVHMVNTFPPEAPVITGITPVEANPALFRTTQVLLAVNPYLESENVVQFQLYRATSAADAASLRTMTQVATFGVGDDLVDTFADLQFPPFGLPVFYRVVALRMIKNELDQDELVPSIPSKAALTAVVDSINPPAPVITYTVGTTGAHLLHVTLTWSTTAYNARYYLYRMNSAGNWVKIYDVKPDLAATSMSYPPGGDFTTYPETADLLKDDNGTTLYYRFKVVVENASGLLSTREEVLVI